MSKLRFNAQGKCELTAEGQPKFKLFAYSGGVMYPHLAINWSGPVVADLAGMVIDGQALPVHRDHDTSRPVGHTTAIEKTTELIADGIFSISNQDSQELIESGKAGFPWKASVGLSITDYETFAEGQKVEVNGRSFDGPVLVVTSSSLEEISFVTVPGDSETEAKILAMLGNRSNTMPTFEEWLASLGFDPASLSEDAKAVLMKQYGEVMEEGMPEPEVVAEDQPEVMAEDMKEEEKVEAEMDEEKVVSKKASASKKVSLRAELAAEAKRAGDISRLCAKYGKPTYSVGSKQTDLAAFAIEKGWSLERTELECLKVEKLRASRGSRPQGPAIHSKSSGSVSMPVLQAAMLMRGRADVESSKWSTRNFRDACKMDWLKASGDSKNQVLDAAYKLRNASLLELTAHALRVAGKEVPADRTDLLRAAFSTGAVSNLYGATIGAKVLEGYNEVRDFTAGWTTESENPDMENHERIRMVAAQNLAYLPIGGEAAHAYRSTLAENIRVERFARQMEVDEADLLGDNFQKLADTPRDFGLAAARLRPDLGANILLANPTLSATSRDLFNATDGNKFGSAALSRATLSAAIAAMSKFKDGEATLNLAPSHIVVPPDLMDLAIQLTQSTRNATTSANEGEINPLAAYGIVAVSEARLANGVVDPVAGTSRSGSTSTWYLVSREAHTIEFVYLQGAGRAPVVRTTELVNGRFGLNIDVRHYIGAKALDWRGFVYNQSASL
jgi:hypothetical protein